MRDTEEFWDELLAQIEMKQVIPVVGPELLTVMVDERETPLYEVLAERLLAKYGLVGSRATAGQSEPNCAAGVLRSYHELNDAVCALTHPDRHLHVQDLYRPINDLLNGLSKKPSAPSLESLRQLASISAFRIFVSTTPDDLLARAIDAERHQGKPKTENIVFAPKIQPASGTVNDLPEVCSTGYTAVCYLFGKSSATPFVFAIHDEDTLEFIHNLQLNGAEVMKRLFSELCKQNLLFIGCNFPDWLSRFFIRISNTQRLADNRSKREFLIEESADSSSSLTFFLERFSPNTWVLRGNARKFVADLRLRWRERYPESAPDEVAESDQARLRAKETFFISYSHTDLPAARRILSELEKIGADVAWFDKSELRPGDDWNQKIKKAIDGCYIFLPLISANTEAREEGFFHEEWKQACKRVERILGRKFIIPIVLTPDYQGNPDRYRLVPENFQRFQFGHAPEGILSDELRDELKHLIRQRRVQEQV